THVPYTTLFRSREVVCEDRCAHFDGLLWICAILAAHDIFGATSLEHTSGHDLHDALRADRASHCGLADLVGTPKARLFGGYGKDVARAAAGLAGILSVWATHVCPCLRELRVLDAPLGVGGHTLIFDFDARIRQSSESDASALVVHPLHGAQSYPMGRAATRLLVYAGILAVGVSTAAAVLAGPP